MPRVMPPVPTWDRLKAVGPAQGVDRESKVIRGYVVAQRGPFKSQGRGQFTDESLARIVTLMRQAEPAGLKSRFAHPTESNDAMGSFLGRARNARLDGDRVRADLHLDPSSFTSPKGNLGQYVLDLAASDPDALSSSLVLKTDKVEVTDEKGRPKTDATGEAIPPVWLPTQLHASDIVDTGDAVDGLLSAGVDADGLPLGALWKGCELLDRVFTGQPYEVVRARCLGFLDRYLSLRFADEIGVAEAEAERVRRRLRLAELTGRCPPV